MRKESLRDFRIFGYLIIIKIFMIKKIINTIAIVGNENVKIFNIPRIKTE